MRRAVIACMAVCNVLFWAIWATWAAGPAPSPPWMNVLIEQIKQMNPAEQQQWLRGLERRAEKASRLTLSAEAAAQHDAQLRDMLHRKTISWMVLREALAMTDAREKAAVEMLVRRYETLLAEKLKDVPDLRSQYRDAWAATDADWQSTGGNFDEQDKLLGWLEAAAGALNMERIESPPPRPTFVARVKQSPPVAKPQVEVKPEARPDERQATVDAKEEQPKAEKPPRIADRVPNESRVPPPSRGVPRREAAEPSPDGEVQVNFEELAARIAGCNLALKALEAELDEKGPWNAGRLEPLAKRLQVLVVRRGDLELFRCLAPEEMQATLGKLDWPKAAIAQLGARIFEARRAVESPDFSGTPEERELELKRLDAVSRRLAETVKGGEEEKEAEKPEAEK